MEKNILGFNVYHAPDGCDEEFVGFVTDLDEAKKMVGKSGLERCLWDTARDAGHYAGMYAPEGIEDIGFIEWLDGDDGRYYAVAVIG